MLKPASFMDLPLPHIPVGGRLRHFWPFWSSLTSDPEILDMIMGMSLDIHNDVPQNDNARTICFSQDELSADAEIKSLLQKQAITQCNPSEQGQFVNNVFLTPKKDGGY